jgi:cysteine desulfurase / selenocysteine lyase
MAATMPTSPSLAYNGDHALACADPLKELTAVDNLPGLSSPTRTRADLQPSTNGTSAIDVAAVRKHFLFPRSRTIVTNNAASTQPPRELVELYRALSPHYESVHRGQSDASRLTTLLFEDSYETIASFINAPSMRNIVAYRNTTEANNAVMYSLMTEFRDGDNVVTTMMEHNSNYVPWYGLCREILPAFGVRVEYRLVQFDAETGELDLAHMASLIDSRTKLVCCSGASNFLGTRNPLHRIRELASASGYVQPDGSRGSYLLVDGAQLVPSSFVDVQELGVDFLSFSFHKILAPFGVGVLYARESLLQRQRPFLYGGDMIAEGRVTPERVEYNALPWKFTAGTPNTLGTIVSAQAIRLLLDFALHGGEHRYFQSGRKLEPLNVRQAMDRVTRYTQQLTQRALDTLRRVPGITLYGSTDARRRAPLVSFNLAGRNPMEVAKALNTVGVESRAGCHCATLAHHALKLDPPASCRLSFYIYNTPSEVDFATSAVRAIASA